MKNLLNIEDVIKKFEIILFDTCAICNYLDGEKKDYSRFINKIENKKMEIDSLIFLNKFLKKEEKVYFIGEVIEEFFSPKNFKRKISKIPKKRKIYHKYLRLFEKERDKLFKTIKKQNKIISLSELERKMYEKNFLKNLFLQHKYELHGADYKLLIKGKILSETRGKLALITNDFKLLSAYKRLEKNPKAYQAFLRPKKEFLEKYGK